MLFNIIRQNIKKRFEAALSVDPEKPIHLKQFEKIIPVLFKNPEHVSIEKLDKDKLIEMKNKIKEIKSKLQFSEKKVQGIVHEGELGITTESAVSAGLYDIQLLDNSIQLINIQSSDSSEQRVLMFKDWLRNCSYAINYIDDKAGYTNYENTLTETIHSFYSSVLLNDNPESEEGKLIRKKVETARQVRIYKMKIDIERYGKRANQNKLEILLNQTFIKGVKQHRQIEREFQCLEKNVLKTDKNYFSYCEEIFYVMFNRLPNNSEKKSLENKNNRYKLLEVFGNLKPEELFNGNELWSKFYRDKGCDLKQTPSYLDLNGLHFALNLTEEYLSNLNVVYNQIILPEYESKFLDSIHPFLLKLKLERQLQSKSSFSDLFKTYRDDETNKAAFKALNYYLHDLVSMNIQSDLLRLNRPLNYGYLCEYAIQKLISMIDNQKFPTVSEFFTEIYDH